MPPRVNIGSASRRQRGFSLIELSIAMLIALFLLGGLITLVTGTRRSSGTQNALSQLQDNERIAMTLIDNIVQEAGYYPYQWANGLQLTSFTDETFNSVHLAPQQVVGGIYNATAPGDIFAIRFNAPYSDTAAQIVNCAGQSNTMVATSTAMLGQPYEYFNVFQVATVNGVPTLQCLVRSNYNNGTTLGTVYTINLIPNVTNISVLYGVGSNTAGALGDFSVVQYLNANQMTATNWQNVTSVKVTLTFLMPQLGTTGGQMMSASAPSGTTTFQRIIPIMARTGVNVI